MLTAVSKSVSEKYRLRFDDSACLWAEFVIDEDGFFAAQSDCGSFHYRWPYHGRKSFKHFLIEIAKDSDYLLRKIASRSSFDARETRSAWFKSLAEMRRADLFSKQLARELWGKLSGLLDEYDDPHYIEYQVYDITAGILIDPADHFGIARRYPYGASHFAQVVMPAFAMVLQQEV